MRKWLWFLIACFAMSGLYAQSANMKQMVEAHRSELDNMGWRIIQSGYVDLNSYRPVSTGTLNLRREYAIMLFIDGCISADLVVQVDGEELELKHQHDCIANVTRLITSLANQPASGTIVGKVSTPLWQKAYLLVGMK